jgi:GDP/UDP-N,N'-diacetylbacillosamine 2-epimerase (hydrolysing)
MKIGVLTSSRADYGIYLPLLEALHLDPFFDLEVIAFGTHLSKFHGYTLNEINSRKFKKIKTISTLIANDDEQSIATTYGLTTLKFADFWTLNSYDIVLCLGDRFEMNAAVQAGIAFGVKFAHLHGGETTLGAIDNIYRHQITLASKIHFTATEAYKHKVIDLIGADKDIFVTGALSLNNINTFDVLSKDVFYKQYDIPEKDYALVTFQPETVDPKSNIEFAKIMKDALTFLLNDLNLVITMPNADTFGTEFRRVKELLKREFPDKIVLVENFGKTNYFTAMKYCKFLLGNTSSGIIEAASFGKYVVNVGNRQKGRAGSDNILQTSFTVEDIVSKAFQANSMGKYTGVNIYYKPNAVKNIVSILKAISNEKL